MQILSDKCSCGGTVKLNGTLVECLACGKTGPTNGLTKKERRELWDGLIEVPDIDELTLAGTAMLNISREGFFENIVKVIRLLTNLKEGILLKDEDRAFLWDSGFTQEPSKEGEKED